VDDLSELSCDCDKQDLKFKVSIGAYNDHFDLIKCENCKKRTKAFWRKDEAVNAWKNSEFFERK